MSGQDVAFGKARRLQGSLYTIIFGYKEKTSALRAGRMAVKLVKAILKGQPVNMGQWISELKDMLIKGMLGPSTQAIYSEV